MALLVEGNRLRLQGGLTVATAAALCTQTPSFSSQDYSLDLTEVTAVDSAGLALVLYWSQHAAAASAHLVVRNPPAKLRELAQLYALEEVLAP